MIQSRANEEAHARYCGVRSARIALCFVAVCVLMLYLNWRDLGKPYPRPSAYDLFWEVVSIACCYELLMIFRCLRERVVVALGMLIATKVFVSRFVPMFRNEFAGPIRFIFLVLWVCALLTSLSMFVSSSSVPKSS
jgi:FtsH-binding integral membrane protein